MSIVSLTGVRNVFTPMAQQVRRLHVKILTPETALQGEIVGFSQGWWPSKRKLLHGTTREQLGDQLKKGFFENRGLPIYADQRPEVAAYYAWKKKSDKGTPVVVELESRSDLQSNDLSLEGFGVRSSLGMYSYLDPSKAPVRIAAVYELKVKR